MLNINFKYFCMAKVFYLDSVWINLFQASCNTIWSEMQCQPFTVSNFTSERNYLEYDIYIFFFIYSITRSYRISFWCGKKMYICLLFHSDVSFFPGKCDSPRTKDRTNRTKDSSFSFFTLMVASCFMLFKQGKHVMIYIWIVAVKCSK